jgi:hypothetical protein
VKVAYDVADPKRLLAVVHASMARRIFDVQVSGSCTFRKFLKCG